MSAGSSEAVELTQQLVRIPSPNPGATEAAVGDFVFDFLSRLPSVFVERRDCLPGRANIVARLAGGALVPPLALIGHMDTVPVGDGWSVDPFGAEIREGKLYGRGSADMKAGLAVAMLAFAHAAKLGRAPDRELMLCATVDEEVEMSGVGALIDQGILDAHTLAVATEPTDLRIAVEHKGLMWIEIIAHGRLAHAGNPTMGIDAVRAMAEFITRFHASIDAIGVRNERLGIASATFSGIHGGIKTTIVPDHARLEIDIRLPPPLQIPTIIAQVEACIRAAELVVPGARLVYRQMDRQRPPVQADLTASLVTEFRGALRDTIYPAETKDDALYNGFPAYSDASMLQSRTGNKNCVLFGPGHLQQAHTVDEFIDVGQIDQARNALARLAERLCFR